jgi:hypothetical protein
MDFAIEMRQVRIVDRGGLKVAVPLDATVRLSGAEVEGTRRALRHQRLLELAEQWLPCDPFATLDHEHGTAE